MWYMYFSIKKNKVSTWHLNSVKHDDSMKPFIDSKSLGLAPVRKNMILVHIT